MESGATTSTNTVTLMKKLQCLLRKTKYIDEFNVENITIGKSEAYVPIYYHIFYKFSQTISTKVSHHPVKLFARNDAKFVQGLFRLLKDVFNFVPHMTREQFLQTGFSKLKITTCIEVVQLLYKVHINESNVENQGASATAGKCMNEQSKIRRSNASLSQRQSMQELSNGPLLDKEKKRQCLQMQVPKTEPIPKEPTNHSTPKESATAVCSGSRTLLLSGGSSQSSINLDGDAVGLVNVLENGTLPSDLQADVNELKKQVASLTSRLDEIRDYVFSPVHVLPVQRPRMTSLPDIKL